MRRAFGLPQVLLILLFVGGIVTVTMKYASLGAKHYADSYTREQAELFLQSATEAGLLRIGGYDRSDGSCLSSVVVDSPDGKFQADVTVERYFFADGSGCSNGVAVTPIQTPESHGMLILKVVVDSADPAVATTSKVGHSVHLERRSLQRP